MQLTSNNIRVKVQRRLAEYLTAALPDTVLVMRRLPEQPPEGFRALVLPGRDPGTTTTMFLGPNRANRDEQFTVRVVIEGVKVEDQEALEDEVDALVRVVEDTVAENPRLGDLDGLTMFGVDGSPQDFDVTPISTGVLWRAVEITFSARARYD